MLDKGDMTVLHDALHTGGRKSQCLIHVWFVAEPLTNYTILTVYCEDMILTEIDMIFTVLVSIHC